MLFMACQEMIWRHTAVGSTASWDDSIAEQHMMPLLLNLLKKLAVGSAAC